MPSQPDSTSLDFDHSSGDGDSSTLVNPWAVGDHVRVFSQTKNWVRGEVVELQPGQCGLSACVEFEAEGTRHRKLVRVTSRDIVRLSDSPKVAANRKGPRAAADAKPIAEGRGREDSARLTSWHIGQLVRIYSKGYAAWFTGKVTDLPQCLSSPGVLVEFLAGGVWHRKILPACSAEVHPLADTVATPVVDAPLEVVGELYEGVDGLGQEANACSSSSSAAVPDFSAPRSDACSRAGGAQIPHADANPQHLGSCVARSEDVEPVRVAEFCEEVGEVKEETVAYNDNPVAEHSASCDELGSPAGGVQITLTEKRGITVSQLEALLSYIRRHCIVDGWITTNPSCPGHVLDPQSINLYDVVHWVVKPVTERRKCSYVEHIAIGEQVPQWFVSHWWGEAVRRFVLCLQQHRRDRNLDHDAPYWVCAYANNQWDAVGEVGANPAESSFRRAMDWAQGTVTVLDEEAKTFGRIWCGYEIYVSLTAISGRDYLYDVYTAIPNSNEAVGLTDGPSAIDAPPTPGLNAGSVEVVKLVRQRRREGRFPLELALKALSTKIESADASRDDDRRRILNTISGRGCANLNDEPLQHHENYDRVNRLLRGRFAVGVWRSTLERGSAEQLRRCSEALKTCCAASLRFDLVNCKQLKPNLGSLILALPSAGDRHLQHLVLRVDRNNPAMCDDLGTKGCGAIVQAVAGLGQLRDLTLGFVRHTVGDEGAKALADAITKLRQLDHLDLNLAESGIRDEGAKALAGAVARHHQVSTLQLDLGDNRISSSSAKAWATAVMEPRQLRGLWLFLEGGDLGWDAKAALQVAEHQLSEAGVESIRGKTRIRTSV